MELVSKLKELGPCGADIPLTYGGPGLSGLECGMVAMEIARVDVSIATFYGILQPICMMPIYKCGT
jgi:glutaryl-CoA dehydrogenase